MTRYFRLVAEQGLYSAEYSYTYCLMEGKDVEKNAALAKLYFDRAVIHDKNMAVRLTYRFRCCISALLRIHFATNA